MGKPNEKKHVSKSGIPGIDWYKRAGKWRVAFWKKYVYIYVGMYDSLDEAKLALEFKKKEMLEEGAKPLTPVEFLPIGNINKLVSQKNHK